jgi:hypothetical protein
MINIFVNSVSQVNLFCKYRCSQVSLQRMRQTKAFEDHLCPWIAYLRLSGIAITWLNIAALHRETMCQTGGEIVQRRR